MAFNIDMPDYGTGTDNFSFDYGGGYDAGGSTPEQTYRKGGLASMFNPSMQSDIDGNPVQTPGDMGNGWLSGWQGNEGLNADLGYYNNLGYTGPGSIFNGEENLPDYAGFKSFLDSKGYSPVQRPDGTGGGSLRALMGRDGNIVNGSQYNVGYNDDAFWTAANLAGLVMGNAAGAAGGAQGATEAATAGQGLSDLQLAANADAGLVGVGSNAGTSSLGSAFSAGLKNAGMRTALGKASGESWSDALKGGVQSGLGSGLGTFAGDYAAGQYGNVAGNAVKGAFSAAGAGGNPLQGALMGGLNSYTPNVAGGLGIDNPSLANGFNSALKTGLVTGLSGGDWGRSAGMAALPGLVSAGAGALGNLGGEDGLDSLPGTLGGTMQDADGESSVTLGGEISPTQLAANDQAISAAGYNPIGNSDVGEGRKQAQDATGGSDALTAFMGKLLPSSNEGWGQLAEGIAGMYLGNKQRRDAKKMMGMIGARRGAYESTLRNQLSRRDAAAGRRSDYSGRETQLQGALAKLDAQNAPAYSQLTNMSNQGLFNMLASGLRYGGKQGWFGGGNTPAPQAPVQQPNINLSFGNEPTGGAALDPWSLRRGY